MSEAQEILEELQKINEKVEALFSKKKGGEPKCDGKLNGFYVENTKEAFDLLASKGYKKGYDDKTDHKRYFRKYLIISNDTIYQDDEIINIKPMYLNEDKTDFVFEKPAEEWWEDKNNFPMLVHNGHCLFEATSVEGNTVNYINGKHDFIKDCRPATQEEVDKLVYKENK